MDKNLWIQRVKDYWAQASRYIQYMLNSLIYTVIITLVIAAYYYAAWLRTLDATFPFLFVIALIVAIILTSGKVRTFLKEPDKVFLLPYEHKLKNYFKYSFIYSLLIQFLYVGLLFLFLTPLYQRYEFGNTKTFYIVIIFSLLLKTWNLLLSWYVRRINENTYHWSDFIVRFTVNFLFVYFLLMEANVLVIALMTIIVLTLHWVYHSKLIKKRLQWESLIKIEENSVASFYRLANLFTDVPHLKAKVKPRRLLTHLLKILIGKEKRTFTYIYWRTFIRSGDYLGIYLRLLVIGGILLFFIPNVYVKMAMFFLFIYLSGFQLLSLWKHIDIKLWINLYPLTKKERKHSFQKVHQTLLIIKSVFLLVVLTLQKETIVYVLPLFAAGVIFIIIFSRLSMRKKG